MVLKSSRSKPEHFEGGDTVVDSVHPNGDPEVSCFFAGKPED